MLFPLFLSKHKWLSMIFCRLDLYFFPILDIYTPIDRTILGYKELFSPIRRFSMKKAAVIHDLSGFGKCSLTAAIPVLSALGVQCCPVATAVLTGQTGYPCYHCTDLTAMLPDYIDAWGKNNAHFDAIYSGFLTGAKQISQVLDFIRYFREEHTLLLVDPVMGDDGNAYPFFTPGLLNGMKELTLKADVITPNLTEACLLADIPENALLHCRTNTDLLKLAEDVALRLQKKASHPQDVVITGVKCRDEKHPVIYNIAATANGIYRHESPFFDRSFSGTGDLFASVLCGCRTKGMCTEDAILLAGKFLSHSIGDTMKENTPGRDGVNFENFLIDLIADSSV